MAGKVGNQNASKHGGYGWLHSRRLPPGKQFKDISRCLKEMEESLIKELGGVENLSSQQRVLLDDVIAAQGIVMLLMADIKRWGTAGGEDGLRPTVKVLPVYLNTVRRGLQALGLEAQSRDFDFDLGRFSLPPL